MNNIYLVKENPICRETDIKWIEMDQRSFLDFIHSPAAAGRYFVRLPRDLSGEGPNVIYETDFETYLAWRKEKRHIQYLRDCESESGYQLISYNAIDPTEDCYGEELIHDESDVFEEALQVINNELLRKLWKLLSDDEQWLLTELVIKGRTDRALSAETGIHHGTLNYRKRAILKKLRKYFE